MRSATVSLAILLLAAVAPPRPAGAMQFEPTGLSGTDVVIAGRGPIVHGDAARLERALASVPDGKHIVGLALDSPGGTVVDGAQLAQIIRERGMAVVVPANSKCASACFLMFAAAPHRLAAGDALIGVHGASDHGKDTDVAKEMTTIMARKAAELGVPSAIIGKMVVTSPSRVEWLTHEDLQSMDAVIYDDNDTPAMPRQPTPVVARPLPSLPPSPVPAASPYDQGRSERRAGETWLASLRGPYRDGASFWSGQRVLPQPGSCSGPNGISRGEFTAGCEAAKQRLAASDAKARASPDYRIGWNSGPTSAPALVPARAEAEFQGAIFCGSEPTRLTLRLLPADDPRHRRALYSLGSGSADRARPSEAFAVEGRLDLAGGAIDLRPASIASQPAATGIVGLQGRSDDGGRTFAGRVTANPRCTLFTLKRTG
jgi:hypothetical protein